MRLYPHVIGEENQTRRPSQGHTAHIWTQILVYQSPQCALRQSEEGRGLSVGIAKVV